MTLCLVAGLWLYDPDNWTEGGKLFAASALWPIAIVVIVLRGISHILLPEDKEEEK